MIKILIADDHGIFRTGLKHAINDTPGMSVTGEAADGHQLLAAIGKAHYDVVIADISMPGPDIFELISRMKAANPRQAILVLTMHSEDQYAVRIFKAGASGYLTKDTDEAVLIEAIRRVCRGGKHVSPSVAEKLVGALGSDFARLPHEALSNREFQVMLMIAGGKSNSDIAGAINLSATTISTYRARILEKMGFSNNAEIIHYAMANGLIG